MAWTVLCYAVSRAPHRDCQPGGAPGDVVSSSAASTLDSHTSVPPFTTAGKQDAENGQVPLLAFCYLNVLLNWAQDLSFLENCITRFAFIGRPTKVPQSLTHSTEQCLKAGHTHKGGSGLRTALLQRCR